MKRLITLILTLFCALLSVACGKLAEVSVDPSCVTVELQRAENGSAQTVIITLDDADVDEGATLLDVMKAVKGEKGFTYALTAGMVTEICGVKNDIDYNPCWMLYTDDGEMANAAWGTFSYEGRELGSAVLGAGALTVKSTAVYIWTYKSA